MRAYELTEDDKMKTFTCRWCKKEFSSKLGKFCPNCFRFQDTPKVITGETRGKMRNPLLDFSPEEQKEVIDYYLQQIQNSTEKDAWDYWSKHSTGDVRSLLRQLKILRMFDKKHRLEKENKNESI